MRKLCMLACLCILFAGCSQQKQYETLSDPCLTEEQQAPGVIQISATDDLAAPVIQTENGDRLYIADDYTVTIQTMAGGDLNATLKSCTGFGRDRLTVMETEKDGMKRYDCAWTAAGEESQSVGRITILEDAGYHYVLTVTAPGSEIDAMTAAWQELSDSFSISTAQ